MIGNQEARSAFVADLSTTDTLVDLLERIVQTWFPPLSHMVERLLTLVNDKEGLHEDFTGIVLGAPPDVVWRALDSMYPRLE